MEITENAWKLLEMHGNNWKNYEMKEKDMKIKKDFN